MNRILPYIILLIVATAVVGCSTEELKVYHIDSEKQQVTLTLFSDSTFTEKIQDANTYSGNWKGVHTEQGSFTTTATMIDNQIITLTPIKKYIIINGKAVLEEP